MRAYEHPLFGPSNLLVELSCSCSTSLEKVRFASFRITHALAIHLETLVIEDVLSAIRLRPAEMATPPLTKPSGLEKEFKVELVAAAGSALRRALYTALASKDSQDSDVYFMLYALDTKQAKQLRASDDSTDVATTELGTEVGSAFLNLSQLAKSAAKNEGEDEAHKATLQLLTSEGKPTVGSIHVSVRAAPLLRAMRDTLKRVRNDAAAAVESDAKALGVLEIRAAEEARPGPPLKQPPQEATARSARKAANERAPLAPIKPVASEGNEEAVGAGSKVAEAQRVVTETKAKVEALREEVAGMKGKAFAQDRSELNREIRELE